jgi:hypothetical protein
MSKALTLIGFGFYIYSMDIVSWVIVYTTPEGLRLYHSDDWEWVSKLGGGALVVLVIAASVL